MGAWGGGGGKGRDREKVNGDAGMKMKSKEGAFGGTVIFERTRGEGEKLEEKEEKVKKEARVGKMIGRMGGGRYMGLRKKRVTEHRPRRYVTHTYVCMYMCRKSQVQT